jgi:hypothetical protein
VDTDMNIRSSRLSALVAVAVYVLSAGTSIAQGDVEKRASEVRIYGLGDPAARQYEVVSRIWSETWRSAFWVPTYPSQEQAITALQNEAARRGADGLINVICLDQGRSKWFSGTDPAILCDAIAVRIRSGP